jgi:hypothetical protein
VRALMSQYKTARIVPGSVKPHYERSRSTHMMKDQIAG